MSQPQLERLRGQIDAGEHMAAYERLAPPMLEDGLAAIGDLPHLSPQLRFHAGAKTIPVPAASGAPRRVGRLQRSVTPLVGTTAFSGSGAVAAPMSDVQAGWL